MQGRVFLHLAGAGGAAYREAMQQLRPILALILSALLLITTQSMAVARGQMVPDGRMVLCTGAGSIVILTDANGQPTDVPHACPDCILTLTAHGPLVSLLLIGSVESVGLRWPAPPPVSHTHPDYAPLPRGPPLL